MTEEISAYLKTPEGKKRMVIYLAKVLNHPKFAAWLENEAPSNLFD